MKETFFTSDLHFNHKNILKYNPDTRPYSSMEEMTEKITDHWNKIVRDSDTVYILGDTAFCVAPVATNIFRRLKGKKILIVGNHDKKLLLNKEFLERFTEIHDYLERKIYNHYFMMFHFPIWEWNKMHHGAIHLHGHVHGKPMGIPGKILDVGWDAHGRILSYEDIIEMMKDKEIRTHGVGES